MTRRLTASLPLSLSLIAALAVPRVAAAEERPPGPAEACACRPLTLKEAMEQGRFRVSGWVEAMISASPGTESEFRTARVFDIEAEGFRLHQAYLAFERYLSDNTCCWDVGAKVAVLWGTDAALLHSRGLLDDQTEREQFDLLEAHVLLRVPVADGLTFKAGKCTTPMGFEVIEAPNNLLPSRSFTFGFAIPFTHAGVLANLKLNSCFSVGYGLVQGWDVWDDNNDAWSHMGMFAWTPPSGKDTVTVNAIVGPERTDDDESLRTVLDATWVRTWSDCWKTALNADVGFEEGAAPDGSDAAWWGVAGYLTRTFNDRLAATLRAEWFRDRDGTRLGTPASLTGLTLGADWKPIRCAPGFRVRPEVRWDHSLDGVFFDDATDEDQFSLILDLLFTF